VEAGNALPYTDKKEDQVFLIHKEIQNEAVAKSYMTNGLLIQGADDKLGQTHRHHLK
jgi:hypothetical protein